MVEIVNIDEVASTYKDILTDSHHHMKKRKDFYRIY